MRIFVVGDIHGCWAELRALLDKADIGPGDCLVALGDFVDRGPDSASVLAVLSRTPGARAVIGNHERKHVRAALGQARLAASQVITRHQLGTAYADAVAFMSTLPYFLDTPAAVLVHGFLEPGVDLADQDERVLAGTAGGAKLLQSRYPRPWYELYEGDKALVVGHENYTGTRAPFVYRDRVYGLDTGCCHGGALTGLLLPEFELVQVPSARDYWQETVARYRHVLAARGPEAYEHDLQVVVDHVHRLRDAFLAELRTGAEYDTEAPREQARRYAELVGDSPLAGSLFAARTRDIDVEWVRRLAPTVEKLKALMDEASLVSAVGVDEEETGDRAQVGA